MSIIEELWNGNINPSEEIRIKANPEYEALLVSVSESYEKLKNSLCEPQKALFERFVRDSEMLSVILEKAAFRQGFILGAQITSDIYK